MTEAFPDRFEPNKKLPDEFRDQFLYQAAVRMSRDAAIPAIFPSDSLEYLWKLAYTMPRRGVSFSTVADEFIEQLAIAALPDEYLPDVAELRRLQQSKEDAIRRHDFVTAAEIHSQREELKKKVAKFPLREITIDEIRVAMLRVGVNPDEDFVDNA